MMIKHLLPSALIVTAVLASALPSTDAKADGIAGWLANLPAGGNIAGSDVDHGFCLSGWSLRQTADHKIFWWHCGDENGN